MKTKHKITIYTLITLLIISSLLLVFCVKESKYDLNSMQREELIERLEQVDNIGNVLAERIADNRPINTHEELMSINGINRIRAKNVLKYFKLK